MSSLNRLLLRGASRPSQKPHFILLSPKDDSPSE